MIYGRGTPLNKIAPKVPILKGQRLPFIPLQLWGNMKKGLVYPRKVPLTLNPTQMTLTGVSLGMGGAWMPIMTRMLPPGTTHSTATCRFLDIFSTTSETSFLSCVCQKTMLCLKKYHQGMRKMRTTWAASSVLRQTPQRRTSTPGL